MYRFSHLSNLNTKLNLSTPYAASNSEGLTEISNDYNQGSFSIGLRFKVNSLATFGTMFECIDSTNNKNVFYYIDVVNGMIRFATNADGAQDLASVPAIDTIYHWSGPVKVDT
jgi:hypothetical protein